mgnify:CR=1 FL=1
MGKNKIPSRLGLEEHPRPAPKAQIKGPVLSLGRPQLRAEQKNMLGWPNYIANMGKFLIKLK